MLLLKSEGITGILDEGTLTVYFGKEQIHLPKNAFLEPGDTIRIRNRDFLVLKPDSIFFWMKLDSKYVLCFMVVGLHLTCV